MLLHHATDLQATAPSVQLALDDVGVTGVVRGIIVGGAPTTATFDVGIVLDAQSRGAHMSRFHEAIDHALALVGEDGRDVPSLEMLAGVVAMQAGEQQGASHARATVRATICAPRIAPASARRTIDSFEAWATVTIDRSALRTRTTIGVAATGMTACPCAQNLVRDAGRERLAAAGMDAESIELALRELPIATHNQRSTASLEVTVPSDGAIAAVIDPIELADLVRDSMSAPIHELLKRADELAVVEAAHADPRFVEDCVRALLRDAVEHPVLGQLGPQVELAARQLNHESIHAHDVVAARRGTLAALREELGIETAPNRA
ncbi:MAG: cyclohydrolase FolE2 [Thermoleophilia bacterium]|nr:cyclohydrolase FolE2 [Thermoleophilia bacterium]